MIHPIRWLGLGGIALMLAGTAACGKREPGPVAESESSLPPPPRRQRPPAGEAPAAETPPFRPGETPAETDRAVFSEDQSEQIPDDVLHAWLQRAGRDPEGTLREALALEDQLLRETLAEWILSAWTAEDRREAAEWAERYLNEPDPPGAHLVLAELLPTWTAESPQTALAWVRDRLPASLRDSGESLVAAAWAATDPQSLARWLDGHPADQLAAIWWQELVHGLIPDDPAQAYERTAQLATPAEADEMREVVLRSWLLNDPEHLDQWLQTRPELQSTVTGIRAEMDPE